MMLSFVDQLPTIASIFFLGAMIGYWTTLSFPQLQVVLSFAKICMGSSFLCLGTTLALRWIESHYFPLSNLYESLLFLSWSLVGIHLILEWKTQSRLIGVLTSPLLVFLSGFSNFTLPVEMQRASPLVPSLQSNWLMMHVSMMMSSYALLLVGSLFSILYVCLYRSLPAKVFSPIETSGEVTLINHESSTSLLSIVSKSATTFEPLLDRIDLWSYRILGLGFPFLTIGIISGAVWANEAWGSYWSWDPKETWALITWLVFASYFHARFIQGWEKQSAAVLGALGFFVIWICYLGVNFFAQGLHSYGWLS